MRVLRSQARYPLRYNRVERMTGVEVALNTLRIESRDLLMAEDRKFEN